MGLGGSKHLHEEGDRVLIAGRPNYDRVDNEVITSRYTLLNFLPLVRHVVRESTQPTKGMVICTGLNLHRRPLQAGLKALDQAPVGTGVWY